VKEIAIGNTFCSKNGKERQSLSSLKSFEGLASGLRRRDLQEYVVDLKIDWDGDIQRDTYELVVRYYWV
jgi:hypothetical protein